MPPMAASSASVRGLRAAMSRSVRSVRIRKAGRRCLFASSRRHRRRASTSAGSAPGASGPAFGLAFALSPRAARGRLRGGLRESRPLRQGRLRPPLPRGGRRRDGHAGVDRRSRPAPFAREEDAAEADDPPVLLELVVLDPRRAPRGRGRRGGPRTPCRSTDGNCLTTSAWSCPVVWPSRWRSSSSARRSAASSIGLVLPRRRGDSVARARRRRRGRTGRRRPPRRRSGGRAGASGRSARRRSGASGRAASSGARAAPRRRAASLPSRARRRPRG